MFELNRLSLRARRSLEKAQHHAFRMTDQMIRPEYLLLGMFQQTDSVAGRVMRNLGVQEAHIEHMIVERVVDAVGEKTADETPLSPDAQALFTIAADEADKLGHNYVGTEHILLALTSYKQGSLLTAINLKSHQIRHEITLIFEGTTAEIPSAKEHD